MTGDQLLSLAPVLVGVAAVNLAVLWLLVRRNRDPAKLFGSAGTADPTHGAGDRRDPPPLDADGDTAVCRHCGAENRAEFRYCRWCARSGVVEADAGVAAGTGAIGRSP